MENQVIAWKCTKIRMIKNQKQHGFTLIELLAVAAVIALAVSSSVFMLLQNNQDWKLDNSTQKLALAIKTARIEAIETAQPCMLVLDDEKQEFFLLVQAPEPEILSLTAEPQMMPKMRTRLPDGFTFEKIGVLGGMLTEDMQKLIVFRPDGSAQTALIQIGNGTSKATVTVLEATGRIQITMGELESLSLDRIDLDEES